MKDLSIALILRMMLLVRFIRICRCLALFVLHFCLCLARFLRCTWGDSRQLGRFNEGGGVMRLTVELALDKTWHGWTLVRHKSEASRLQELSLLVNDGVPLCRVVLQFLIGQPDAVVLSFEGLDLVQKLAYQCNGCRGGNLGRHGWG